MPVVVYGNRNFDDALIELRDIMEKAGFQVVAAGAFIGEHSFSRILAKERPDAADLKVVKDFASRIAAKIENTPAPAAQPESDAKQPTQFVSLDVEGVPYPYRGYYQPKDASGAPVDIRKVKPLTKTACIDCKTCARLCPMGSISHDDVRVCMGICMKCCSCVKNCPQEAKFFGDPAFIYHKHELEEGFRHRAEPRLFI